MGTFQCSYIMEIIAILLFCIQYVIAEEESCKQIDPCRCRMKDNKEINLHNFPGNFPQFSVSSGGEDFTYSPCKGLPCGKGVVNSTVCTKQGANVKSFGGLPTAQFSFNKSGNFWTIQYKSKDKKRNSTVQLICSEFDAFQVYGKQNSTSHQFRLSSPCVCPDGCTLILKTMSTGTILLLIFFSLITVYFGVGCLYRKTVYGATGMEIFPNSAFWFSLPALIRDGYLFFISPCLGERVEYRYYDKL